MTKYTVYVPWPFTYDITTNKYMEYNIGEKEGGGE